MKVNDLHVFLSSFNANRMSIRILFYELKLGALFAIGTCYWPKCCSQLLHTAVGRSTRDDGVDFMWLFVAVGTLYGNPNVCCFSMCVCVG